MNSALNFILAIPTLRNFLGNALRMASGNSLTTQKAIFSQPEAEVIKFLPI